MKTKCSFLRMMLLTLIVLLISTPVLAQPIPRKNKMPDIPQDLRPEWGDNWCAPTAVGNSFVWLAKEYPWLDPLVKAGGNGVPLSGEDVVNVLGRLYMETDPATGTHDANTLKGKIEYIKMHGLQDKIIVETMAKPSKEWIKEQIDKGQDVEVGLTYLALDANNGTWRPIGGHVETRGNIPGEGVGGHIISLSGIIDPYESESDTDYILKFTDPGRDDLTGDYGCIAHEQYLFTDAAGIDIPCTESTYNVIFEPDFYGAGKGAYLLNGYQGPGDFGRGEERILRTEIDIAWSESPIPEPATLMLLACGGLALLRKRK
ncbi:MAG: PEP-CTERM sorting domain-containing protein [Sedimentisphaerales bacterium]